VGAAGSTGRGEECIKINGAHTVVEMMRRGASPREASLEAVRRVAANYRNNRKKLEQLSINFYALNKRGEHGAASLWNTSGSGGRKAQYAVNDGGQSRLVECAYLLER
jgi:N4-(beta-N-acetylglucosaminyl)-L-asparaginase